MTQKEKEDIAEIVGLAVSASVEKELGQYKVPKERHYQEHLWLKDMMDWADTIKISAVRSAVGFIMLGFVTLLVLGFVFWGRSNLSG